MKRKRAVVTQIDLKNIFGHSENYHFKSWKQYFLWRLSLPNMNTFTIIIIFCPFNHYSKILVLWIVLLRTIHWTLFKQTPTWQDKEDSRDEGQNSALRADVSNITQHKANEHEEQTDQRERSSWANHFCEQTKINNYRLCIHDTSTTSHH